MSSYEFVETEREGNILKVTLNRPKVYNAMHPPMHHELDGIWNDFAADQDLWVAVLTGAGDKAFSAGNDLKYTASGGTMQPPASGFAGLANRLDREKPVIAAVNGFAMGGGMETALACDIIIAADTATFALPEVKVGFFAGAGGVQRLSRQIGRKAAIELMLSGRRCRSEGTGHRQPGGAGGRADGDGHGEGARDRRQLAVVGQGDHAGAGQARRTRAHGGRPCHQRAGAGRPAQDRGFRRGRQRLRREAPAAVEEPLGRGR